MSKKKGNAIKMGKDSLSLFFALPFLSAASSTGVYVTENLEHTSLGVAREPSNHLFQL